MIRAVLDPGVLIAAAISRDGAPASLLRAWYDGAVELVACPHLLDELRRALAYPKVGRLVSSDRAAALIEALQRAAIAFPDPRDVPAVCRDPQDDYLFALARDAGAVLVSGDRDVLETADPGVRVLRPGALASLLEPQPVAPPP